MALLLIIKVPTPVDQRRRNHDRAVIIADPSCPRAPGRRCRYRQVRRHGCGGRSWEGAGSAGPAGCAAPHRCDSGAGGLRGASWLPVVHRDRRVGRRRLGQVEVASKTNEIPLFPVLCDRLDDLRDAVITADALHAQRGHADYLVLQRGAHYLLTVKGNQPSLLTQTTPQK
jgi:hypothetical protein